jgi:RNA polymerase sigma-70 factor, ECF subfamily
MEAQEHISDEALIAAFREDGMPHHLDILFLRHLEKVRAMLYQMVLNDADADDLTQEAFLRTARNIGQFSGRAAFPTWLYRIAMNCANSFLTKRQRSPIVSGMELPDATNRNGAQPDQILAGQELDARIQDALGKLRPKMRAAVVLTIIQGLSQLGRGQSVHMNRTSRQASNLENRQINFKGT